MEVKIGIRQSNREVVVESDLSADELADTVAAVIRDDTILTLDDTKTKGRRVLVPAGEIAYLETGPEHQGRVGFGIV